MRNPGEISYKALRLAIGWLGLTLPFAVVLLAWGFQTSISEYYYTNVRDYFEGVLFLLAAFLFAYNPYGADGWKDHWITNLAGAFAVLLVLFPTQNTLHGYIPHDLVLKFVPTTWSSNIHNVGSAGLFLSFAVLSFFFFTLGSKDDRTPKKAVRNVLYRVLGLAIGACIAYIGFLAVTAGPAGTDGVNIFVPESLALVFFGASWLIKGGAFGFLND